MIEKQVIDGRPVTIGYFDEGFAPAAKDTAAYAKLSFDDGETIFLSTADPGAQDGDAESAGWSKHRTNHQTFNDPPTTAPAPVIDPFALRRASRRERTPHDAAVRDFALAMQVAEKPRGVLKKRFGYNDKQIGTLALAFLRRLRKGRG